MNNRKSKIKNRKSKIGTPKSAALLLILLVSLPLASGCARMKTLGHSSTPEDWRRAMQPPLTALESRQLGERLGLGQAIQLGVERNPGVAAERKRWLAAIYVEPQAASPPDPMLEAGAEFMQGEGINPVEWTVGLSQQIPWWRKLWAMGKTAAAEADIARFRYEAVARDLIIEIKDAYYELYYLDQALPITEKIEAVLRNDAVLAYAELNVGRTQLNEAFRAESQAAQLAYDRILLTEQRAAQAERLKSLLNLPPDAPIGPTRTAPLYRVSQEIGPLYQRAERYAETLRIHGLEIQKAEYETYLARLARIPDVTIGLGFLRQSTAGGASSMGSAGRTNSLMTGLSMNLPIWEQRNRALIREKEALEEAARRQALDESNRVRQAVAEAFFAVRLTQRLVRLYAETLLPQAEAIMRQAEIDFRNDQAAFSDLIETTLAYHNFLLAHHRAVADQGQATGRLEKVLGTTAEPLQEPQR